MKVLVFVIFKNEVIVHNYVTCYFCIFCILYVVQTFVVSTCRNWSSGHYV